MSKADDKIPILFKYNNKIYRILEFIYRQDDSIFFIIPRKKGFYLDNSSEKKFYKKDYTEIKREFKDESKKYEDPKISFHPSKMVVHINSNNNHVKTDYKIFTAATGELFLCYLLQIVYPIDFSIFDEYNKAKDNSLLINDEEFNDLFEGNNLSLEIFIHSNGLVFTDDIIPKAKRNVKYVKTYYGFGKYDITVLVSELTASSNESVLVNINTIEKNLIYNLKTLDRGN